RHTISKRDWSSDVCSSDLNGFIGEEGGYIVIKWRFYKKNYPFPYDEDGWTDWFTSDLEINLKLAPLVLPSSTIDGPDIICDNGIYTITNPGEISLIDPSGIAQISYLGDNKWRLSRIEFISGEVKIKSKVGDVEYSKSVIIGAKAPSILGGSKVVWSGNTYYYDVIKS